MLAYTKGVKQHRAAAAVLGEKGLMGIIVKGIKSKMIRKLAGDDGATTWKGGAKRLVERAREHQAKAKAVALVAAATREEKRTTNVKTAPAMPAGTGTKKADVGKCRLMSAHRMFEKPRGLGPIRPVDDGAAWGYSCVLPLR